MESINNDRLNILLDVLFRHIQTSTFEPEQELKAKRELFGFGIKAIPLLINHLDHANFWIKKRSYDLIIEMGTNGIIRKMDLPSPSNPIESLWLNGILHFWKVSYPKVDITHLLESNEAYICHLAALSLTFLGKVQKDLVFRVIPILISALKDDSDLEGSGLTISGAALNCISDLSGKKFFQEQADVVYLNFQSAVFPPPIVPFPLTGDQVATASADTRRSIQTGVEKWWKESLDKGVPYLRVLPDPFSI